MRAADADILFLPGLGDSGPAHWQRRWAERLSTARVVEQDEWDDPRPADWVEAVAREVMLSARPVVLVAHSLGVLAAAHAARFMQQAQPEMAAKLRGAFLVAPPDLERESAPEAARRFGAAPREPLPFPSLLVASTDDPYCSAERAADMAAAWGSDFHLTPNAGHINVASGHGPWPEGLVMFTRLMQRLRD